MLANTEDHPQHLLPAALLFAIGASRVLFTGRFRSREGAARAATARELTDGVVAALCLCSFGRSSPLPFLPLLPLLPLLPAPSIVPYWDFATRRLSKWHLLLPPPGSGGGGPSPVREAFLNGPLGLGASKVVHVLVAVILWRLLKKEWPAFSLFGSKKPGVLEWGILAAICLAVNLVLKAWSHITQSRGDHEGVFRMVASCSGRVNEGPTLRERLLYGSLAFVNAVCEEISFRWFWKAEFAAYLPGRHRANLAQAAVFGILHYYGIPSGLAGVGLTFVYGFIMGVLMDEVGGGGLFLPIFAHTIADYYIFSTVAQGKVVGKKAKT
ncbi:hypothetical protein ACHAWF_007533 [Thalassiosira exigua]